MPLLLHRSRKTTKTYHLDALKKEVTQTDAPTSSSLLGLINSVKTKLDASDNPTKDQLEGYSDLLKAAAEVQKTLPTTSVTTFSLPLPELGILAVYLVGGVVLMLAITQFLSGASWKADNLVTIFLYWTIVVGILLGANGLSSLLGSKVTSSTTSGN